VTSPVTDVDRDGYGVLGRPGDPDIFDARVHPYALDVPGNGDYREPWQDRPIELPEFMLGFQTPERFRAYRITDGAMAAEGICENDIALIELRQFVRDGDRVVAIPKNKCAVLRRYYRAGADIDAQCVSHCPTSIRWRLQTRASIALPSSTTARQANVAPPSAPV